MKKPTKARKHGGKKQYKVRNWREYNQALVDRGKVMFWITEEALRRWEERKKTGKRGKPRVFSDIAIETALTLREVFHLPYNLRKRYHTTKFHEIIGLPVNGRTHGTHIQS